MPDDENLEGALAATQAQADAALRAAGAVVRELKKARTAAANGTVRDLRRALGAAEALAGQLSEDAATLRAGYAVDESEYLASGAYAKEVLALGAEAGLSVFEEDDRLLCYPSLVRVLPTDQAVEIDRRRERRLRPSVLVAHLGALQREGPRFKAEPFLESLQAAYDLTVARHGKQADAVIRVVDAYAVLTLLPGAARDYAKQEFARDLYLLDQSGVSTARDGRALRWAASSGTRGAGVLSTVTRTGQHQRYWGIAFEAAP